jgi:hypothetical protein
MVGDGVGPGRKPSFDLEAEMAGKLTFEAVRTQCLD